MKFVPARASRFVGRQRLKLNANSPTILLGAGIVGVVGTAILASRATLKAQPVFSATTLELDHIRYNADKAADELGVRPDESDLRKKRIQVYGRTTGQLLKLYGPTVIVGTLSIGCLVQSHKILNDRYSNMAAAYVSLQEAFGAYRKRVQDSIGEDNEKDLYYNGQNEESIVVGPNGPKKEKRRKFGDGGGSPYARLFGPDNRNWKTTPEYNITFLRQVEEYLNLKLRTDGHLFLNRAFEELGMDDTEAGSQVGWLYERGTGNDYIDFGIFDEDSLSKDRLWDFMVGNEGEIMLDFNVDGPIYKLLNLPKVR